MSQTSFGQFDIVRLSKEDATTALVERAVKGLWDITVETGIISVIDIGSQFVVEIRYDGSP